MADSSEWIDQAARRVFTLSGRPDLRGLPELFDVPCPSSVHVSAATPQTPPAHELHAIGIHEPRGSDDGESNVHLTVRPTGAPVVLFLMCHRRTVWHVAVEEGARLFGIVLASNEQSAVRCAAELAFVAPVQDPPIKYTWEARESSDLGGEQLNARLRALTGMDVTSFQGSYHGDRFTVPAYPDVARVRAVLRRHGEILAERTTVPPASFLRVESGFIVRHGTRQEPIRVPQGARAVAFCDVDGRYYVITDHDLYAVDAAGNAEKVEPVGEPLSWLGGVAWDSRRRRLLVTTFWHAGVHHLYDPVARVWQAIDVEQTSGGIYAIAYDASRDVLFALGTAPFACRLIVLRPDLGEARLVATTEKLPLPDDVEMTANMRAQLAVFPDAVLVSCGRHDLKDSILSPDAPPRDEQAYLVRLDRDEVLRVDLGTAPRHDPVTRDFTSGVVGDGYEGWVTLADLRRDARVIVEQVARTELPLLVTPPAGPSAMLVSYALYQGQLASLDETTFPDWRTRLVRAEREIAERQFAPPDAIRPAAWFLWTTQAADDFAAMTEDDRRTVRLLTQRQRTPPGGYPMDGPFHGWFAGVMGTIRVVYQCRGPDVVIGYLRPDARHTFGRLVGTKPGDARQP